MNFKKRVNGSWTDAPHYIHNTSTDTITTLPAVIYPNAATATVGLKGNTVQNGTPSPDNPIMPQGTGERTGNLYPLDENKLHVGRIEDDGTIGYQVGTITVGTDSVSYQSTQTWRGFYTDFIQVNESEQLTFSQNATATIAWSCSCYDENDSFLGKASPQSIASTRIFTLITGTKKVRMSVTSSETTYTISQPMLNTGSTALPYEPYGIKIPISSANTTTQIYLGEVQTTRRIQKLVLTGQESTWVQDGSSSGVNRYRVRLVDALKTSGTYSGQFYISHYAIQSSASYAVNRSFIYNGSVVWCYICVDNVTYPTVEDYKTFLAAQYAAGTPVCVWYVLSTPQTAVVNEPLMKIGNYADEVSGVSIPVTAGGDTLSVGTTVHPSEVTATYKGWHPVQSVHVYPDSSWMPT